MTVVKGSTCLEWYEASSGCETDRKRVRGNGMGCGRTELKNESRETVTWLLVLINKDDLSAKLLEIKILQRWDLRVGHAHPDGFLGRSVFGTK